MRRTRKAGRCPAFRLGMCCCVRVGTAEVPREVPGRPLGGWEFFEDFLGPPKNGLDSCSLDGGRAGEPACFFLHRAVAKAISEAMRGHVLSWNVLRGEEGRVHFFCCRVWFSFEDGAATSSFVVSYCWCCALLARRRSQLWSLALGGAVCICTPSPTSRPSPQVLRTWVCNCRGRARMMRTCL